MVTDDGSPPIVCAPRRGGIECDPVDAGGREGAMEGLIELSEYYNSPGRLAVVRRQFESTSRGPGVDPATFATELGILAVRGFENMGERARDLMI